MLEGVCTLLRTKIRISIQSSSIYLEEGTLFLSESLVKKWKIPTNNVALRHGSIQHEVKVVPISLPNSLRMLPALAVKFGLHHGAQLCIRYKPSTSTLFIGPLLGVMVSRFHSHSPEKPFGTVTAFCKEITEACQMFGAQVFFLTPDDMQGSPQTVNGHVYINELWSRKPFPVPNVIYNRLTSRKYENMANVQQFMKDAKVRSRTHIFNEKYLDKTEVFDALSKDESLHGYLPESYLFKNYQMLYSMSSHHDILFLKPVTGSLGKGIIRIRKEPGGSFTCHFTDLNGARKQVFPSLSAVFQALAGKLRSQKYQLQQGLDLITADGRSVDFRALVQKGAQGVWTITSIVARIANTQHFVSNLARGGSLGTVKETLAKSSLSAQQRVSVYGRLRKVSLEIAQGIESQIPHHFGELGIDLAVDKSGKIWLLEVNSKPSKDDNTPLSEMKIRPSVKHVVQYARYLAKY
jgi:hypothetical protein